MESSNRVVRSAPKKRFYDDEHFNYESGTSEYRIEKKRGHWSNRNAIKSKRFDEQYDDYH